MIDPVLVAPFAYIASIVGTVLSGLSDHLHRVDDAKDIHDAVASALELLPTPMIGVYNNPLPSWRDSRHITFGNELGKMVSQQHWWSEAVGRALHHRLLTEGDVRDSLRLQCQSNPFSGAWLSVLPGHHIGSPLDSTSFQHLLKFRIGLPLLPITAVGQGCTLCEAPLDALGDHLLCCKFSNPWARHNFLRDFLMEALTERGFQVQPEVSIDGMERPADIYVTNWSRGRDACLDITVVHAIPADLGASSISHRDAIEQAEARKRAYYAHLFPVNGTIDFLPIAFDTLGQFGRTTREVLDRLHSLKCGHKHLEEPDIDGRPSLGTQAAVGLAKTVGAQLCLAVLCPPSADDDQLSICC